MTRRLSLKVERFNKICRTCLSDLENDEYISLFKTYLGSKVVKDVLETFASIEIMETDKLPPHMCNNCLVKLINSSTFMQQCQEANVLLKSLLSTEDGSNEEKQSRIIEIIVETSDPHSQNSSPQPSDLTDDENAPDTTFHTNDENTESDERDEIRPSKHKKQKADSKFMCRKCNVLFHSMSELKLHQKKTKHNYRAKNYTCSYCSKAFPSRDHMNRHIRTHTKEKPYHCSTCGMNFSMVQNLRRHEKLHTGERPYKCDMCGKGFIQRASLTNHKKTNIGCATFSKDNSENLNSTSKLRCTHCGKAFKRLMPYNLHLKRHEPKPEHNEDSEKSNNESEARMYVCDVCKKSYKNKNTLKAHQLTHGEKKFLCSECGKDFVTKAALESHQKVHTKEKPHTCGICNKSFAYTGSFDTHMLVHTGEKKYVCKICSKTFKQGTHLKYHLRVHSGERPYSCVYCGKSFAVKGNLTVHIRTHTGETPFACPVCGKGFYDSGSLKKHRASHGEVSGDHKEPQIIKFEKGGN